MLSLTNKEYCTGYDFFFKGAKMYNVFKMIITGSLVMALINACSTSSYTESAGQYLDSSTITTKVKASLVDQLGTGGFAVTVKTYKDQVQLGGFVDTPQMKLRAGTVAAGVDGVRSISNNIIVKSR